jgi:hypothetical protein
MCGEGGRSADGRSGGGGEAVGVDFRRGEEHVAGLVGPVEGYGCCEGYEEVFERYGG